MEQHAALFHDAVSTLHAQFVTIARRLSKCWCSYFGFLSFDALTIWFGNDGNYCSQAFDEFKFCDFTRKERPNL